MKIKRRRIKRGRIEIIPMIDTIVILLIFYMTFSRFVEASREAQINLPEARAGEEFKQLPGQVIINMYNKDEAYIDRVRFSVDQLPPFLISLRERDPKFERMSVILRADRSMSYADLSAFMKACARARITDVTFTTLEIR